MYARDAILAINTAVLILFDGANKNRVYLGLRLVVRCVRVELTQLLYARLAVRATAMDDEREQLIEMTERPSRES